MFSKKGKPRDKSLENAGGVSFDDPKEGEALDEVGVAIEGEPVKDPKVKADVKDVVSDDDATVIDPVAAEASSIDPILTDEPKKAKRRKAKKEKAPKAPKVKKEKSGNSGGFFARFAKSGDPMGGGKAEATDDDEASLPMMVIIDYYRGMTKEREAEQLIRATIEKNFDAPNASYFYIQKFRDGLAVEMQEGGGRAYLPEILAKIEEDPQAVCVAPMSNRVAQVRLDPDTKSLETLLLQANQLPPEEAFTALPTEVMRPFDRRGSRVFLAGVGLLAASFVGLLFALGSFFIDTDAWALPYVAQTPVKDLPMAQMQQMESALASGADCIYKMEYVGGNWTITPGYDNDGTCGPSPSNPMIEGDELIDGEVVTIDGASALPGDDSVSPPPPAPDAPGIFGPPAGAPSN